MTTMCCPAGYGIGERDPRSRETWEDFWQESLSDEYDPNPVARHFFGRYRWNMGCNQYSLWPERLRSQATRRMLIGGNGISILPDIFAHRGFLVEAVDFSENATRYAREHPPDLMLLYKALQRFQRFTVFDPAHPVQENNARQFVESEFVAGGQLSFRRDDLFEMDIDDGTYDAVVLQRVADWFDPESQYELGRRAFRWLRPGGILFLDSSLNRIVGDPTPGTLDAEFEQLGFLWHAKPALIRATQAYIENEKIPFSLLGIIGMRQPRNHSQMTSEYDTDEAMCWKEEIEKLDGGAKLMVSLMTG